PAIATGHLAESHPIEVIRNGAGIGHHIHRHNESLPLAADDPSSAVTGVLAADADAAGVGAANVVCPDRDAAIHGPVIHSLPFDHGVVIVPLVQIRNHEIDDHGELVDIRPAAVGRDA